MGLKEIDKWYVTNKNMTDENVRACDRWCIRTFGDFRHDTEKDEGWWLQSEEEYTLFVLTWGTQS